MGPAKTVGLGLAWVYRHQYWTFLISFEDMKCYGSLLAHMPSSYLDVHLLEKAADIVAATQASGPYLLYIEILVFLSCTYSLQCL